MSDDLTLWDIQSGLRDLIAAREEAAEPADIAAAEEAITAYVQAEVRKVGELYR